jgi:hypothetical protein
MAEEAKEFKMEDLVSAADDLNKVLQLDPPIVTVLEVKGRGAAKAAAEKKFIDQLIVDIKDVAQGQDEETKKFDLQEGDLTTLQSETVELIYLLSPETKGRLTAGATKGKAKAAPKAPKAGASAGKKAGAPKKEGPGVIASILEAIPKKGSTTLEKIHEFLIARFPDRDKVAMKKTINAQLGGKKSPTRLEREKGVKLTISDGKISLKA